MPYKDHFPATKQSVENYEKTLITGTFSKNWLGFSYIRSEDYKFDPDLEGTEMKINQITKKKLKLKTFDKRLWLLRKNGFLI